MSARIIEKFRNVPAEELTPQQVSSLEWAQKIQQGLEASNEGLTSKRQRSQEEEPPHTKRPRPNKIQPKSYSDAAKNSLILGVIDKSVEEGRIPKDKWKWVANAVSSISLQVLEENPGPPPSCEDAGWHQGQVKLIACADERSATLYKVAISKVGEVWPGAMLEAVDKKDIPSRPRARVWIPTMPSDPEKILKLFRICNPHLPTQNWKIAKLEETDSATRQAVLLLNAESVKPLAEAQGRVAYGFEKVVLKVYRTDALEQDTAAPDEGEPAKDQEPTTTHVVETAAGAAGEAALDVAPESVEQMEEGEGSLSAASSVASLTRLFEEDTLLESHEEEENEDANVDADATMVAVIEAHESASN